MSTYCLTKELILNAGPEALFTALFLSAVQGESDTFYSSYNIMLHQVIPGLSPNKMTKFKTYFRAGLKSLSEAGLIDYTDLGENSFKCTFKQEGGFYVSEDLKYVQTLLINSSTNSILLRLKIYLYILANRYFVKGRISYFRLDRKSVAEDLNISTSTLDLHIKALLELNVLSCIHSKKKDDPTCTLGCNYFCTPAMEKDVLSFLRRTSADFFYFPRGGC